MDNIVSDINTEFTTILESSLYNYFLPTFIKVISPTLVYCLVLAMVRVLLSWFFNEFLTNIISCVIAIALMPLWIKFTLYAINTVPDLIK